MDDMGEEAVVKLNFSNMYYELKFSHTFPVSDFSISGNNTLET